MHGHARHTNKKRYYTRTSISYESAKGRCRNPNDPSYKRYGGRGIKFRFKDFLAFYAELGDRPAGKTLDRFPSNNGDYKPGNVRWATPKEQGIGNATPLSKMGKRNNFLVQ
jgi:hypothetical protein